MKCPLKQREQFYGSLPLPDIDDTCIQEECAWWVKASGSCAMEAIPRIIGFLGSSLEKVAKELTLIRPPGK